MTPPLLNGPITFQGDAHGKLDRLAKRDHPVIQVGDLGIGFVRAAEEHEKVGKRDDFWFIRGNHDSPDLCRANPRYLGEFGVIDDLFFASGAWSIDQAYRIEGQSWWRDEELSSSQMNEAHDLYVKSKPRIVVTHDAPASLFEKGGPMELKPFYPSSTAIFLQILFETHVPEIWLFGHHHLSRDFVLNETRFRCLAELETVTLDFAEDRHFEFLEY
jgi:hypothetical protein